MTMSTNRPVLATPAMLVAAVLILGCGSRGDLADRRTAEGSDTAAPTDTGSQARGQYATVNGLKMYYEIHGTGQPLVLLHGGLSNIETDFGKVLPVLARTRQVIAIEQQAHGHTSDTDRPLNAAHMADDTAELLRQLTIENADFFGYSMGAGIALQMAIRHPELVRKLVLAAPAYTREGFYPEVLSGIESLKPQDLAGSPWQAAYARIAPNPEHWDTLVAKASHGSWVRQSSPLAAIRSIRAPALIIIGDSDVIRPEHIVELFRLLGGGVAGDLTGLPPSQLAVLPGTTHVTLVQRTDWLLSMIQPFLDGPMPEQKQPEGR